MWLCLYCGCAGMVATLTEPNLPQNKPTLWKSVKSKVTVTMTGSIELTIKYAADNSLFIVRLLHLKG